MSSATSDNVPTIDDGMSSKENQMIRQFKIVVEKHTDGYVAYPLNLRGVVVGQGDSYEEALADVKSAITFHIETFGPYRTGNDRVVQPGH